MTPLETFLAHLATAAERAGAEEQAFRAEMEARAAALAHARAEAYRRANFMRAVTEAVAGAGSPEAAAARACAHLCARFGWSDLTPAREEVLARFESVAAALSRAEASAGPEDHAAAMSDTAPEPEAPDPQAALAAFEAWYFETRQSSFWHLFEHYMPDTPRVDF